jgi:hypothetical protein
MRTQIRIRGWTNEPGDLAERGRGAVQRKIAGCTIKRPPPHRQFYLIAQLNPCPSSADEFWHDDKPWRWTRHKIQVWGMKAMPLNEWKEGRKQEERCERQSKRRKEEESGCLVPRDIGLRTKQSLPSSLHHCISSSSTRNSRTV